MIYEKLMEIQKELFVPKGQTNNFGGYNYRSCEDILKAVKPICEAKGCVLILNNELIEIGGRNYVQAEAKLLDVKGGEVIACKAQAREEETKKGMDGSQITGAASSYARKYALAGLFCIDNEKDSDVTNDHGKDKPQDKGVEAPNESKGATKASEKQIAYIKEIVKDIDGMLKYYKIDNINDLTKTQASAIIASKGGKK
jgi:hypothetical protein